MGIMNMSKDMKTTRVMAGQAAGATNVNGDVLDMQGFECVEFTALFGTLTAGAVTGVKVQQGQLADGSDMADLLGSAQAIADTRSNDCLISDLIKPQERYIRLVVTRATQNAVIDGVIAKQYLARTYPVTHDAATVAGSELLLSPIEGTA